MAALARRERPEAAQEIESDEAAEEKREKSCADGGRQMEKEGGQGGGKEGVGGGEGETKAQMDPHSPRKAPGDQGRLVDSIAEDVHSLALTSHYH